MDFYVTVTAHLVAGIIAIPNYVFLCVWVLYSFEPFISTKDKRNKKQRVKETAILIWVPLDIRTVLYLVSVVTLYRCTAGKLITILVTGYNMLVHQLTLLLIP